MKILATTVHFKCLVSSAKQSEIWNIEKDKIIGNFGPPNIVYKLIQFWGRAKARPCISSFFCPSVRLSALPPVRLSWLV